LRQSSFQSAREVTWPNKDGEGDGFDDQQRDVEVEPPVVILGMNYNVLNRVKEYNIHI